MESTLFTTLTANEEANFSGGIKFFIINIGSGNVVGNSSDDYSINVGAAAGVGNIGGTNGTGSATNFTQKQNVGRRTRR
ncbi:hypothetical protein [Nostoc sp. ChiVER01]|uniref:hypothetical protein n=1 Tax=Nostoc sp. ChiVER01 TaxID=3075382 RepID=UPI002AD34811|nr:hypothetical protein [Nostoc sp. ChiVER01]MDZ8222268.1 hypothetical protein [Nostoc sp. ChiVER01]